MHQYDSDIEYKLFIDIPTVNQNEVKYTYYIIYVVKIYVLIPIIIYDIRSKK